VPFVKWPLKWTELCQNLNDISKFNVVPPHRVSLELVPRSSCSITYARTEWRALRTKHALFWFIFRNAPETRYFMPTALRPQVDRSIVNGPSKCTQKSRTLSHLHALRYINTHFRRLLMCNVSCDYSHLCSRTKLGPAYRSWLLANRMQETYTASLEVELFLCLGFVIGYIINKCSPENRLRD
jgi:hypothetical protein